MYRFLSLLVAGVLSLGLTTGCSSTAHITQLSPSSTSIETESLTFDSAVGAPLTDFGVNLLKACRTDGSLLVSPFSAALALTMTANGAQGDTLAAFESVLGGGASLEQLNAACYALSADYGSLGGSTQCSIANSLWSAPDKGISGDFVAKCQEIFASEVYEADLTDPGIVSGVNNWVKNRTNGMIPEMISQPFSQDTALLLINALYLKNTWATQFSANDTEDRDFYPASGGTQTQSFLSGHWEMDYISDGTATGVILPYDDDRLAFVALMPDGSDLDGWLASLDGEALSGLLASARQEDVALLLPKFEADWDGNLSQPLSDLGLQVAFDPDRADFSAMGDAPGGYFLQQVIQKTRIKVNEKGTEAAAATMVSVGTTAAPVEETPIRLTLDHPFLYGIVDLETGVPLFLGTFEGTD